MTRHEVQALQVSWLVANTAYDGSPPGPPLPAAFYAAKADTWERLADEVGVCEVEGQRVVVLEDEDERYVAALRAGAKIARARAGELAAAAVDLVAGGER